MLKNFQLFFFSKCIDLRIPVAVVAMAVLLKCETDGLKLQTGCKQHSPSFFTKVHIEGRL